MSASNLTKIAKKLEIKLAQQSLKDLKHISNMATDLASHMDILEGAAQEGNDIYGRIDNPAEANKRMYMVRRLLNSIRSAGKQMYLDATSTGMSKETSEAYVYRLGKLLSILKNIGGLERYTAFTKPLENALDVFTPRAFGGSSTGAGSAYTPENVVVPMTITAPKQQTQAPAGRLQEAPSFKEIVEPPTLVEYGPGMVGEW